VAALVEELAMSWDDSNDLEEFGRNESFEDSLAERDIDDTECWPECVYCLERHEPGPDHCEKP
jgi:hypothetical protein